MSKDERPELAIIGGTGLTSINALEITRREMIHTPYGEPSGPVTHGTLCGRNVVFLARHGYGHTIPPHKINYRANIWALKETGVGNVLAVNAVGGIRADMVPGTLVFPDQIIDYTWSRVQTYFDEGLTSVTHIDFTQPYCEALRRQLVAAAQAAELAVVEGGTYGATQGPRLETAAEIVRLERNGCDMVGMTGMPEAALARELNLCYASCAVVANWAAGKGEGEITMEEIDRYLKRGMEEVRSLLGALIPRM
ncbi:S-methyl-5'-thioinosine phosphorylase [Ectothiorhodospiraceae bacterium 2226]|nr:S-methyl-5'-thioinosine phosphorylase [Ectothiorhodospiraceae bacterium 2226]